MKLLICFRELPYAEPTLALTAVVARLFPEPELILVTIGAEGETPEAIAARLEQGAKRLAEFRVDARALHGVVLDEILRLDATEHPDLIVIGSRDMHGLLDSLLGSVTGKIVERAKAPVLVARGKKQALRRILVPIGGRVLREEVVTEAALLARAAGAEVTLLYVADPVPAMYTGLEAMEEHLDELLQTDTPIARHLRRAAAFLEEQGVQGGLKLRHGVATNEIVREVIVGDYDLLVIGARTLPKPLGTVFMKQVTPRVVDLAECPVLVVR